jgi:hypothetical protein
VDGSLAKTEVYGSRNPTGIKTPHADNKQFAPAEARLI